MRAFMDGYIRAEISASALRHNIAQVRSCLGPRVLLCPVVKANAYGHGIEQVVPVLRESADMLGVAICSEAVALRRLGWHRPVLQLVTAGGLNSDDLAQLVAMGVTLTLSTLEEVKLLKEAAGKAHRACQVHVKIDSGMSRGGAPIESAPAVVAAAREAEFLQLAGLYTHFASADEADKEPTRWQMSRFLEAVDRCGGRDELLLHAANSAGVMDLPETHLDLVRPGIALYGMAPSATIHRKLDLRPALRLTAPIMLIKDVPAGARTGYGLAWRFDRPARIAVVPVGYADGYCRALSNVASMRLRGVDCPVRGRVSMDQTVIEITGVAGAKVGEHVEIISSEPGAPHSAASLARQAGTLHYEVLSRLGDRITRVLVD